MADRALTPAAKREFLDRLLTVWLAWPELRFGQLLANTFLDGDEGRLRVLEDIVLAERAEDFYRSYSRRDDLHEREGDGGTSQSS